MTVFSTSCEEPAGQAGVTVHAVRIGEATTLLTVAGEIDLASVAEFARVLAEAVGASPGHRVVVDLDAVGFLGVCGVDVVLAASDLARRYGGSVVLVLEWNTPAGRCLRHVSGFGLAIVPGIADALPSGDQAATA